MNHVIMRSVFDVVIVPWSGTELVCDPFVFFVSTSAPPVTWDADAAIPENSNIANSIASVPFAELEFAVIVAVVTALDNTLEAFPTKNIPDEDRCGAASYPPDAWTVPQDTPVTEKLAGENPDPDVTTWL